MNALPPGRVVRTRVLPGVSVVMPVRDEAGALPAALRAVAAQDYAGPVEVIVADGSVGPATAAAARATLARVRIVPNPKRIAAAGMNRGIAAAAHPIVVRCDARCALAPDYIRRAVTALERTGAANVGGRLLPAGRAPFEQAVAHAMVMRLGCGGARYRTGGAAGPVDTVPLGVFRRASLAAVGGYDEGLVRNEDYELNWRLRESGATVWFDPGLRVAYRPRGRLRALVRQYVDYGRWKRVVVRRHPRSVRARHLAAPLLTLGLGLSAALAGAGLLASAPGLRTGLLAGAAALPGAWLAALAASGLWRAASRRSAAGLLAPAALAAMHLAWGLGFLLAPPGPGPRARFEPAYKRPWDLALAALAALASAPLWIGAALAVRLEDGGPVLYRQRRLGRGGVVFEMLKFRTMRVDAERATGPVLARERDARSTRAGAVLRRFHIDELPQFVNVLKGEMSVVGPRPERPELAVRIAREVPDFGARLAVRPGIAGLGQARGGYRARPRNKLRYDRLYMRRMGPLLDLWILGLCVLRTAGFFRGPGRAPGQRLRRRSRRGRNRPRSGGAGWRGIPGRARRPGGGGGSG